MKLPHAVQNADLCSFCKEVYVVAAFIKVVQQETIGGVRNSIIRLWADNFCLQKWKNY